MIILTHSVVGITLGKFIINPYISVPIAFGSHFILDMIPHAQAPTDPGYIPNKKTYLFVGIDIILSIIFIAILRKNGILTFNMILPLAASILPDIIDTTRYKPFLKDKFSFYYNFHDKIQSETNGFKGYLSQILIIIVGFYLLGVL